MGPVHNELRTARPASRALFSLILKILKYTAKLRHRVSPFAAGVYVGGFFFIPYCSYLEWGFGFAGVVTSYYVGKAFLLSIVHR
jgi:hypothetical protein